MHTVHTATLTTRTQGHPMTTTTLRATPTRLQIMQLARLGPINTGGIKGRLPPGSNVKRSIDELHAHALLETFPYASGVYTASSEGLRWYRDSTSA